MRFYRAFFLAFHLPYILRLYLIILIFSLAFYLIFYLAFCLRFHLTYCLTFYLAFFMGVYVAYILTSYLAFLRVCVSRCMFPTCKHWLYLVVPLATVKISGPWLTCALWAGLSMVSRAYKSTITRMYVIYPYLVRQWAVWKYRDLVQWFEPSQ